MLQRPRRGGEFEVIPRIREKLDAGCEKTSRALVKLLEDGEKDPSLPFHNWEFREGTLALFRGSESLHRVTRVEPAERGGEGEGGRKGGGEGEFEVEREVEGDVDRLVAVLCYADQAGVQNTVATRMM